ncbi:apoptosis-resistant E3 ubiquitin protein ligase 1 isoform X1 [Strongylocentrotus purpuratus]|uniref:HECT-type E3 ubiquitin transferase n=2 Tax=Strongylocentrotus purpuratus TaxID=7668 RepID=A0A7M7PVL0_STRPU|nr:apoptosis-resistant E3 ubiquitin protein ligase 1 isoform X1 [Strongylocentrotus purpuratus]
MADETTTVFKYLSRLLLCILIYVVLKTAFSQLFSSEEEAPFQTWLKGNELTHLEKQLRDAGCVSVEEAAQLDVNQRALRRLKQRDKEHLESAIEELQDQLLLKQWLEDYSSLSLLPKLDDLDITAYSELHKVLDLDLDDITQDDEDPLKSIAVYLELNNLQRAVEKQMASDRPYELDFSLARRMWSGITHFVQTFGNVTLATLICAVGFAWVNGNYRTAQASGVSSRSRNAPIIDYITGSLVDPCGCLVDWGWEGSVPVGDTMSFTIKFYQRNGMKYAISDADQLAIEILVGQQRMACSVEYSETDYNLVKCAFTVRRSGLYNISIRLGPTPIKGSPFIREFLAGDVDPHKTGFVQHSSTVVVTQGLLHGLQVEPRDQFGNTCSPERWSKGHDDGDKRWHGFELKVTRVGDQEFDSFSPLYDIAPVRESQCISMIIKLDLAGCYKATATYHGTQLMNGDFNVLVLTETDIAKVSKTIKKKHVDSWYEATLLATNKEKLRKPRKVYCYISSKQFTIKEYYLMVIPKRLFTFRVCPATKFHFEGGEVDQSVPVFSIDDGGQPPIKLASKHRDIMAATFTKFLLMNIGGSETFQDKQKCFYSEVIKHHNRKLSVISLVIDRHNLLESSMKATKSLSTSEWCKKFDIHFVNEEGQDWGGLMREWVNLLCVSLFDPENKLFKRFEDDNNQALVHPNPNRPSYLSKLKYYEFAGKLIGKCLFESSVPTATASQMVVKARFTRSFLAQLIGLRVTHKYFETDDSEFFTTKVRYIRDNEVESMELNFSEEVYDSEGHLEQVVELLPGGSSLQVTEDNKMQYLDLLAQYRLSTSVQEEIDAFLKGLNDLIPDNLLSMFDENELELLICGTCCFDLADLKAHHILAGAGPQFRKMIEWFWIVIASFTQEEMSRLLQFTTGCSQLPPGGFAELRPKFQLVAAPTHGILPTAHTCFNQLCLPTYDTIEHLQKSIVLAITEGNVGFGMA